MSKAEQEHYRKLEHVYHKAPINRLYQPTIVIDEGSAEISYAAKTQWFHAADALHGSAYFKGLDDAAFFAVASLVTDVFVLTASFNVYLLRPVTGGSVHAKGKVTHRSRRMYVAQADLLNDEGRIVAQGSGTFMRSNIALNDLATYTLPGEAKTQTE